MTVFEENMDRRLAALRVLERGVTLVEIYVSEASKFEDEGESKKAFERLLLADAAIFIVRARLGQYGAK
jgi:hypothetical protein